MLWPLSVSAANAPIGTWYGEGQPDNPKWMWVERYYPGGAYEARFRLCHGNVAEDVINKGVWTYSGNINDVVTLSADGRALYQDDKYETLSNDGRTHVYRHQATGYEMTARRVDDKFELPSCAAMS